MPRLRLVECMMSTWGWVKQEIQILNKSSRIVYVTSDPPRPVAAVDPGRLAVYRISTDTVLLTLSYYDRDTREMEFLCTKCFFNKGRVLHIQDTKHDPPCRPDRPGLLHDRFQGEATPKPERQADARHSVHLRFCVWD